MTSRICILASMALISLSITAQVSVSAKHIGGKKKFKKGVLEQFKSTKTIFILSDIYSTEQYEQTLKDTWTVTPFEVVSIKELDPSKYLDGKHSFVKLDGYGKYMEGAHVASYYYIETIMFMPEDLEKAMKKVKNMNLFALSDYETTLSRVEFFPTWEFDKVNPSKKPGEIVSKLFGDTVLFNYNLGTVKNYMQKVSSLLEKGELYWMYANDNTEEVKSLKTKSLLIPKYLMTAFELSTSDLKEIMTDYKFKYEVVENAELEERILSEDDCYYMNVVRMGSQIFVNVVNSGTGEFIFRGYNPSSMKSFDELVEKKVSDLSKAISAG